MASSNARGIPTLPSTLIRPTVANPSPTPTASSSPAPTPPEPADAPEPADIDQADEGQGRGPAAAETRPRATTTRRRRPATQSEKTTPRKLVLPDGVYDRLQLLAIQRRSNVSAIAAELLDRNLPRLRIERDA